MANGGTSNGEATAEPRVTQPCMPTASKQALLPVYMVAFNILCTYAWAKVFFVIVRHQLEHSLPGAISVSSWPEIGRPLFYAQTLAVLEIVHALLERNIRTFTLWHGIFIMSSIVATGSIQPFQLVWLLFPSVAASRESVAFLSCIAAWSCAELLRFPFFAVQQLLQLVDLLRKDSAPLEVPVVLKWFRYSGFTVLYPIGITSEVVCMCAALPTLRDSSTFRHYPSPMPNKLNFEMSLYWSYLILLLLYVPGSVQLYGHMLKQRRKYLYGAGQEVKAKKEN